jgi:hypothetical protein
MGAARDDARIPNRHLDDLCTESMNDIAAANAQNAGTT